jgi:hypothetical protein
MELINSTRMDAAYTMGMEPSGRELLVVVVKGTFQLFSTGEIARLHDVQVPLTMADVFFGEPGRSAPQYEADFSPRKPRCDVLLNASAYAPNGRPTTRVNVAVRIGNWAKTFAVVGDRRWEAGATGIGMTPAVPFTRMPITFDRAFGGTDDRSEDPAQHAAFLLNPSGRGFHKILRNEWIDGSPLPNTEEDGRPVTWVSGDYRPMSFGAVGRHWEPRYRFAGTYDERWLENHFPFLPPDFDEQYYQAAPLDQQIPHPRGGERIELANLTADGRAAFVLPAFDAPIYYFLKNGDREDSILTLDTMVIEPDLQRFTLTWRATRAIRRSMFELTQVVVGKRSQAWWAERESLGLPIQLLVVPGSPAPASDGDGPRVE